MAQLGARFHGMEEVIGSIPIRSTKLAQNQLKSLPFQVFPSIRSKIPLRILDEFDSRDSTGSNQLLARLLREHSTGAHYLGSPGQHRISLNAIDRPAYNVFAVATQGESGANFLEKDLRQAGGYVCSAR